MLLKPLLAARRCSTRHWYIRVAPHHAAWHPYFFLSSLLHAFHSSPAVMFAKFSKIRTQKLFINPGSIASPYVRLN
jgi:hypothetical protein